MKLETAVSTSCISHIVQNENCNCLDCGVPNSGSGDVNTRIIGGVSTDIGEYPWQVSKTL